MKTQLKFDANAEAISALMDGQLHDGDLPSALETLATPEARERWLTYHLVGDVLRSAELARGRHDLGFAVRVSEQLNAEARPAVRMVPAPVVQHGVDRPAANDGVFRWKMVAGLASLAAVAAMGWGVLGGIGPRAGDPQLAQETRTPTAQNTAPVVALATAPQPVARSLAAMPMPAPAPETTQVMLRDPRLDELLAAHRAATGVSALNGSAGFLRNATFEGAGR